MIRAFLLVPLCCATFDKWHDVAKRAIGSFGSGQVMESTSPISMEMRRLRTSPKTNGWIPKNRWTPLEYGHFEYIYVRFLGCNLWGCFW